MPYRDAPASRPPRRLVLYNNLGRARRYLAVLGLMTLLAVWVWDSTLTTFLVAAGVFCGVMAIWSLLFRLELTALEDDDILRVRTWQWPFRREERAVRLSQITELVAHFDELGTLSLRLVADGQTVPLMIWPERDERHSIATFLRRVPEGPTT